MKTIGTKSEVYKGSAVKTAGGLFKDDLMKNKRGKIVSKKQHAAGLKRYEQNKNKLKSFAKTSDSKKSGGNIKLPDGTTVWTDGF